MERVQYQPVEKSLADANETALAPPSYRPQANSETQSADVDDSGRRRQKFRSKSGWIQEIGSVILSVICLVTMAIMLQEFDGRLLSSWKGPVAINTLVAILSTASKAFLINPVTECLSQLKWIYLLESTKLTSLKHLDTFEHASKGPWGSFVFFWPTRSPTKSVVPYIGCLLVLVSIAFDPFTQQLVTFQLKETAIQGIRSSVLTSRVYDYQGVGIGNSGDLIYPRDPKMHAAISNAAWDVVIEPPFSCPGPSCTYPQFSSIGVASSCNDVTSQTTKACTTDGFMYSCNLTAPGNWTLQAVGFHDAHSGFQHTVVNTTGNTLGDLADSYVAVIMTFPSLSNSMPATAEQWVDSMQAYECTFRLSAVLYTNWAIVNGSLETGSMDYYQTHFVSTESPLFNYTVTDASFPDDPTYSVSMFDVENIFYILEQIFGDIYSSLYTYESNEAFLASPNISATVANMARAASFRMLSGPNATEIYGTVNSEQTYIHIRWAWISLPAGLSLAACAFLVVVILLTRRAAALVWKSSLVPLLLTDDSYPLVNSGDKLCWTEDQIRARLATIRSHLTH